MGIILAPLLLLLVVHLLPGLWLGAIGVYQHPNRLLAILKLLRRALILFIPTFFLPFLLSAGKSVDFSFMFLNIVIGAGIIGYGYILGLVDNDSEKSQRKIHRSAAFLAGGFFPVAWFSLSEWLLRELNIKWMY